MRALQETIFDLFHNDGTPISIGLDYRVINQIAFLTEKKILLEKELNAALASINENRASELMPIAQESFDAKFIAHHQNMQSLTQSLASSSNNVYDDKDFERLEEETDCFDGCCFELSINTRHATDTLTLITTHKEVTEALEKEKKYFQNCYDILSSAQNASNISRWQLTHYHQFLEATPDKKDRNAENFITFLLTLSKSFLPDHYVTLAETNLPAVKKFPSSGASALWHPSNYAHYQRYSPTQKTGGILASCAPPRMEKMVGKDFDAINKDRLHTFLTMLFDEKVTAIIELGADKKGIRLDYKNASNDLFLTHFQKRRQTLALTERESGVCHTITVMHIPVDDQQPLTLSNEEIRSLYALYQKSKESMILVHCDSGVGRTGTIILSLFLLNALSSEKQLSDRLLNAFQTEQDDGVIAAIHQIMIDLLNQMRKVRYSIETDPQLLSAFRTALLLFAIHHGYSFTDLNKLREAIGLQNPEDVSKTVFSGAFCESDNEGRSSTTCSTSPSSPGKHLSFRSPLRRGAPGTLLINSDSLLDSGSFSSTAIPDAPLFPDPKTSSVSSVGQNTSNLSSRSIYSSFGRGGKTLKVPSKPLEGNPLESFRR